MRPPPKRGIGRDSYEEQLSAKLNTRSNWEQDPRRRACLAVRCRDASAGSRGVRSNILFISSIPAPMLNRRGVVNERVVR